MKIEIKDRDNKKWFLVNGYCIGPVGCLSFSINGTFISFDSPKQAEAARAELIAKLEGNSKGKFVTAEDIRSLNHKWLKEGQYGFDDFIIKELGLEEKGA